MITTNGSKRSALGDKISRMLDRDRKRKRNQLHKARDVDGAETDIVLQKERYPKLEDWSNATVETMFGRCSVQNHRLTILLANYNSLGCWIDQWQTIPSGLQRCRPFDRYAANGQRRSYTKLLKACCDHCNKSISFRFVSSRLLAITKLERKDLWKAVITRCHNTKRYVFEGSARCNLFGHPNHCMNLAHLNLETYLHNNRRKRHHAGLLGCDCEKRCIGSMAWRQRYGNTRRDKELPSDRSRPKSGLHPGDTID